ncbi:MAG: AAA family ATPase [Bryobacteraceae bacterium]
MAKLQRCLNLHAPLRHKSLFLFGPRQVGKTTFLRQAFPGARYYNLLETNVFRELSKHPELIRERLRPDEKLVLIDEVQRLPALLDEAQVMIDRDPELRFVFTGSSARKLRRGASNMLAGRAWLSRMHPLVGPELDYGHLLERLNRGSLPFIFQSEHPHEELNSYIGTYLVEEVRAEGAVRSIESFSRFLPVAGLANCEQINFTEIGNDCQVPPKLVREYFEVLDDTLIAHQLQPFRKTLKRKPVATAKFYLFDVGVANALIKRGVVEPGTETFGKALEHQIYIELRAYLDYGRKLDVPLQYWRSTSQMEVDFLVGESVGIEVKARPAVSRRDFKGLLALAEEVPLKRKIVVCLEREPRRTSEGIEVMPIEHFLRQLWAGEFA